MYDTLMYFKKINKILKYIRVSYKLNVQVFTGKNINFGFIDLDSLCLNIFYLVLRTCENYLNSSESQNIYKMRKYCFLFQVV